MQVYTVLSLKSCLQRQIMLTGNCWLSQGQLNLDVFLHDQSKINSYLYLNFSSSNSYKKLCFLQCFCISDARKLQLTLQTTSNIPACVFTDTNKYFCLLCNFPFCKGSDCFNSLATGPCYCQGMQLRKRLKPRTSLQLAARHLIFPIICIVNCPDDLALVILQQIKSCLPPETALFDIHRVDIICNRPET